MPSAETRARWCAFLVANGLDPHMVSEDGLYVDSSLKLHYRERGVPMSIGADHRIVDHEKTLQLTSLKGL